MTAEAPDDDRRETDSFRIAERKIGNLLRRLDEKNVCGCCTARALMYRAIFETEQTMGSAEATEMLEQIIAAMRERNVPAPERMPSTQSH